MPPHSFFFSEQERARAELRDEPKKDGPSIESFIIAKKRLQCGIDSALNLLDHDELLLLGVRANLGPAYEEL